MTAKWWRGAVILVVLLGALGDFRADTVTTIQSRLVPKSIQNGTPAHLIVTVKGAPASTLTIRFRSTNGLHVNPDSLTWSGHGAGATLTCLAEVTAGPRSPGISSAAIMTSVLVKGQQGFDQIASDVLELETQNTLGVCNYLALGVIGIALGYALRMLVQALRDTKAQVQARADIRAAVPSDLQKFVIDHQPWVDFAVTLALGFLALVALMKDGWPPAAATYWHNALVMGTGLGLLTNSDLLTRVHV